MNGVSPIRLAMVAEQNDIRIRAGEQERAHPLLRLIGVAETAEDSLQLCELVQPDAVLGASWAPIHRLTILQNCGIISPS